MAKRVVKVAAWGLIAGVAALFASIWLVGILWNALSGHPYQSTRNDIPALNVVVVAVFLIVCVACGVSAMKTAGSAPYSRYAGILIILLGIITFISDTIDILFFDNKLIQRTTYLVLSSAGLVLAIAGFLVIAYFFLYRDLTRARKWSLYVLLVSAAACLFSFLFVSLATRDLPWLSYALIACAMITMMLFGAAFIVWAATYLLQAGTFVYGKLRR